MSGQVLKRSLDQQCGPEVKRYRPDGFGAGDSLALANSRPEVVALVEQLREKYGIHEGIIIAILETCHYNLLDTQREIERFCQCIAPSDPDSRKRHLSQSSTDCQGSGRHPMEAIAEACVLAVQGAANANQAKERICMALDRVQESVRELETKKCEKLQHANKVLFRAYHTLIERIQSLRKKADEEKEDAVVQIQAENRRLEQENQILQWHVSQLNQPERHHHSWKG